MTEVLVWLLISMPNFSTSHNAQKHAHVVERFVTLDECQRFNKVLKSRNERLTLFCAQARIAVVEK